MVKPEHVYAVDTIVRIKKSGLFARITQVQYQFNNQNFLHYLGEIEGKRGEYALYHHDIELEALPKASLKNNL